MGSVPDTDAPNSQFNHLGFVDRSGPRGVSRGSFSGAGFSFATAAVAFGAGFVARLLNGHHDLRAAIVSLLVSRYASVARTCVIRFGRTAESPLSGRNRNSRHLPHRAPGSWQIHL